MVFYNLIISMIATSMVIVILLKCDKKKRGRLLNTLPLYGIKNKCF